MNGHQTHRPWAPSRQKLDTPGWTSFDAFDEKRAQSNPSWLAGYDPRTRQSLPVHHDDQKHSSWALHRLSHLRKSVLRRFPSLQALLSSRRPSLTSSTSISASAPAFPSGDTIRFIVLCGLWYTSSALSSNTGKAIMNQFRYPITLTFVQFGFVAAYCLLFMSPIVNFTKLRRPTKAILTSTFPMGCFQVGGHIFSSMAISRIPVSTVHTIKALSPLFTVAAYAILFGVSYSPKTYFSLIPLTIGVILACSSDMSASNALGLLCAFGSAIVFVSSNIFFKKIMPTNSTSTSHKLDKVNLLFYSSSMAFLLMVPIWAYYDLPSLLLSGRVSAVSASHVGHPPHGPPSPHGYSTPVNFFLNGTVHFLQNVIAFVLLAQTSPVTYSIASLIKRVAVICIAIVWFSQRVHALQGFGICLTFFGLWCYNNAKSDVERGEKKARRVENAREGVLPSTRTQLVEAGEEGEESVEEKVEVQSTGVPIATTAYTRPRAHTTAHRHHHSFVHPPPPLPSIPPSRPGQGQGQGQGQVVPPVPGQQKPGPATYSQTHPHVQPNLHIQIAAPPSLQSVVETKVSRQSEVLSPVESYPSPPPSEDEPVEENATPWMKHRRATITGQGQVASARQAVGVAA
ncbi:hypothetical protein NLI96_g760 [Meripilus lineatus]|uniref:Sugar phosphate transporter domain-containing protein n=1 Tax=Meripilus lineatus TaxID=2056292 RepID=A0AAD5YI77_9APHY|nr:hypothetical protein NLI96_g760 [Physisporinus lineatus]